MEPPALTYVINHLFLPPKLPQDDDSADYGAQLALLKLISQCADAFCGSVHQSNASRDVQDGWEVIRTMVARFAIIHKNPQVKKDKLEEIIKAMPLNGVICLHVSSQNAGVVLRRVHDTITFEYFQASPKSATVTKTKGKVISQFPARGRLALPFNASVIRLLSATLAELDAKRFTDASAAFTKAGATQIDEKEVSDIRYVSEMLGGIARAFTEDPEDLAEQTVYVTKRLGDQSLPQGLQYAVEAELEFPDQFGYKAFVAFVLAKTLSVALDDTQVKDDVLFVMNRKIASRLWKQQLRSEFDTDIGDDNNAPVFPLDYISTQVKKAKSVLDARWEEVQSRESDNEPWVAPSDEQLTAAKHFTLPQVRGISLLDANFSPAAFEEKLLPTCTPRQRASPPLPISSTLPEPSLSLAILDVEEWVMNNLDQWALATPAADQLVKLKEMFDKHEELARAAVKRGPEIFSRLFLTTAELWVAIDKATTAAIPLLLDYSPEIAIKSFEPLVLPELSQMRRLFAVEEYISTRHRTAKYAYLSVFKLSVDEDSFASRYFRKNAALPALRQTIKLDAADAKDQKLVELEEKRHEYAQAKAKAEQYRDSHSCLTATGRRRKGRVYCVACTYAQAARSITIDPFEEPLPEEEPLAQLVVFELRVPLAFGIWRDATYRLARNYSEEGPVVRKAAPRIGPVLRGYGPLEDYWVGATPEQRITFASGSKSFGAVTLPCTSHDVIKTHPLDHRLWDEWAGDFLPTTFPKMNIRAHCTPVLPAGPYQCLKWALSSTSHKPNTVIAEQSRCPVELSYHEFDAFGHLRAGVRLQWRNMMLQLLSGTLNLADPAVYLLFRQASCQVQAASEANRVVREAHFDLADEDFGVGVLAALNARLDAISANWQEGWTAAILSDLACRVLSFTHSQALQDSLFDFLARVRDVLYEWMNKVLLLLKNQGAVEAASKSELVHRVLQLAAACRSTYAVGSATIGRLFVADRAVSIFIQCGIAIQKNIPSDLQTLPSALRYLIHRDALFSAATVEPLLGAISRDGRYLDDAIAKVWDGFTRSPVQAWRKVGDRWVTCATPDAANAQVRHVYLNVIDGSLQVDGRSLGILPKPILEHTLFRAVFPSQHAFEIIPSTMRGMDYQSRSNVDNFEVHFKLGNEGELLIRIRDIRSQSVSEFIPRQRLQGDIPMCLLLEHIHVFHEATNTMDIYAAPAASGWNPSVSAGWQMQFASPRGPTLSKNTDDDTSEFVLNPNSHLVKDLSGIFQPLEASRLNLMASLKCQDPMEPHRLHVGFHRYKMNFFLNDDGALESSELTGFSVAPKQSIGTLIGLTSKLVLESQDERVKVLVPAGTPTLVPGNLHVQTTLLPPETATHVKAYIFDVDDIIGRLVGDGTLTSWYLLIYLHIVTSSHLCDPLLHRIGIQKALEMLASAQSFAFMELSSENLAQLQEIVNLVPPRHYSPKQYSSNETVGWHSCLSPLVQAGRIVDLVNAIVDYARRQAIFYPSVKLDNLKIIFKGDLFLRERAECRTPSVLNVCAEQADAPSQPERCLETPDSVEKEEDVNDMATLVHSWPARLHITDSLWVHFRTWESFSTRENPDGTLEDVGLWLSGGIRNVWVQLFWLCKAARQSRDRYALMFALGILAYRGFDLDLIRTLLAVAISGPANQTIRIHPQTAFNLNSGHGLTADELVTLVQQHCRLYEDSGEARLPKMAGETDGEYSQRTRLLFARRKESQSRDPRPGAALTVPDIAPVLPDTLARQYSTIKLGSVRDSVNLLLPERIRNRQLFENITRVQRTLKATHNLAAHPEVESTLSQTPMLVEPPRQFKPISLDSLLQTRAAVAVTPPEEELPLVDEKPVNQKPSRTRASGPRAQCLQLIPRLARIISDGPRTQYVDHLSRCVDALEQRRAPADAATLMADADANDPDLHAELLTALGPTTAIQQLLLETGQWPSTAPESLMRHLTRNKWQDLPDLWKLAFTRYAEALARMQKEKRKSAESVGVGPQGWNPVNYPDWLLFELDADILIRPVQASIAKQMIQPESNSNALLQLNMGEGKSSVIVPIIAASLADGQQLVRVVVLKPLSSQMFQLLKQRLSGLVDRRLFYLPFSRDIQPLESAQIRQIVSLMKECARVGGILLCQPEHILSFQLMGLDTFCRAELDAGKGPSAENGLLSEAQDWLDASSRDILDESDEILNVRYQLIYTVGSATPIEGQPWRWNVIQAVFSLIQEMAPRLDDIEIGGATEPCRFPITRILTPEGAHALLKALVAQILTENRLEQWISFRNYSAEQKNIVSRFLRQLSINDRDNGALQDFAGDRYSLLLLLRGLLAHGILNLSLQKRWRVDYGLDPKRSMLSVPYRAKDTPSMRSEYGHPDMIIVLTCLSYYYGGLTDDQLNTTFTHLLNSDNPAIRYESWVKNYGDGLPQELATLRGLNLDDFEQKNLHIFPRLRFNKGVIDFYLSEVVFPKEAREFPHKLSTNAWDLARHKARLTTGFSGTNDNRYLLPLSIDQLDQDAQRHTNAQVLEYILQPENREVLCTDTDDAMGLLRRLVQQTPSVMVLLDVGAQVLELQNEEVAREWLKLDTRPNVEAAVYFNPADDEILVLTRDGRIEPFAGSLYKTQLDKTLVYLDEAHTRGTDFKFPAGSRAVVTLGPKLTKDKLVQGCMRMRKLGSDHSVLFFASTEIWQKITDVCHARPTVDSSHVLLWTMHETCTQISESGPLWANQGINFDARRTACEEYGAGRLSDTDLRVILKEKESRTLEELYGVVGRFAPDPDEKLPKLQQRIKERCAELGFSTRSGKLFEEQERELAHEKEDEREVERIPHAKPLDHQMEKRLRNFIESGRISNSFISLEECLAKTSKIRWLPGGKLFRGQKLFATKDFRDTVVLEPGAPAGAMDGYLRAVQWILSSGSSDVLILISPFEANGLLPTIRRSQNGRLHLYSPRVSQSAPSWEALDKFVIPTPRPTPPMRKSIHELNLFAGQLFLADKDSKRDVLALLGLYLDRLPRQIQGDAVDATGFVRDKDVRTTLGVGACDFVSNPLPFLRSLFGWRRKGQGYSLTHLGKILNGNNVDDSEFEENE
ncbi:hypothetical protein FB45DRAFT_1089387 [Roridomyces roridus]|uniref:ubiquitinyl hydrolase 1 n=1 Tax=Roridomyces roridus TaxID=1738132 RepID=A0AAD7BKN5_9AGAR|nr:hypothetical protein FB45DRAFT_1089387 [Roridomyces roridus]